MDINQDSTEKSAKDTGWQSKPDEKTEKKKPELKMPVNIPKFGFRLKMPAGGFPAWIKGKLSEYKRVYSITKKPDKAEFTAIVKASGLGILIIGIVGFIIAMIVQLLEMM